MTDHALEALDKALSYENAERVMYLLNKQGFTVYRKKVSHVKRAPTCSRPMTPALKKAIRHTYKSMPGMSLQYIAQKFDVNIGRVSEALA